MQIPKRSAFHSLMAAAGLLAAAGSVPSVALAAASISAEDLGLTNEQMGSLIAGGGASGVYNRLSSPGISFGSPVAFGADWGTVGVAVGGARVRDTSKLDGSAALVVGLGDSQKAVGLEAQYNLIGIGDQFGEDGSFTAKLHTQLPGHSALAIGVENIGRYGRPTATNASVFVVGTKIFLLSPGSLNMPLAVNVGIGNNRFSQKTNDDTDANVFASVALVPVRQVSVITDWTGRSLNAAVSVAPFARFPMAITLGAVNISDTDTARGRKTGTQFAGGIGYSYTFN